MPENPTNRSIAVDVRDRLRNDRKLRGTTAGNISVTVTDDDVLLWGHVTTSTEKARATQAVGQRGGARLVQNELVVDDELIYLVAQAVAADTSIPPGTIGVAVRHGVVTLSGHTQSIQARSGAEKAAAEVPLVRGVTNHIQTERVPASTEEQRVLQPLIGQEVFAGNIALGNVMRIIIDPNHRRVVSIVIRGHFPEHQTSTHPLDRRMQERSVVIPIAAVAYATPTMVQLNINARAATRYGEFTEEEFAVPEPSWRPPYPYHLSHCLWTASPSTAESMHDLEARSRAQ